MAGNIRYIKIARIDGNGNDLTTTLESLSSIILPLSTGNKEYRINSKTRTNTYYLYDVTPPNSVDIPEVDKHSPNYNIKGTITNYKYP
tara:strand:+ start:96 stop:359 length:264 start_codon:yes stop_codon:yes gene_type:complete